MSWDDYFMNMVYLIASRSKDRNTHIGAVIVGPDHEIRSTGYNSFPRGIQDARPERQEKPEKYFWFEHAERNAIYNAARVGIPLAGCTMYTNGVPCADCARAVIQAGITEVVVDKKWNDQSSGKWKESAERSLQMFREAHTSVRYHEFEIQDLHKYRNGEKLEDKND